MSAGYASLRRLWRLGGDKCNGGNGLFIAPCIVSVLFLAGCSLAPVITEQSIDYNSTVEDVTNSVLVTNILRARDGAPLYFSDLSQIRGSVQLNLQAQTAAPYGPLGNENPRNSGQAGPLAINSQPGFDVAPLNTKNFAQGMLEGLDEKIFAYFIQRGVTPRVFLNLVVSRVEVYKGDTFFKNCTPYVGPDGRACLPDKIATWTSNDARLPRIGELSETTPIGPAINAGVFIKENNALSSLVQADAAKLKFDLVPNRKDYQLSKESVKYVLCVAGQPHDRYKAVGIASPGATNAPVKPPVPKKDGSCGNDSAQTSSDVLYLRSVEAIFYYLGSLLNDPEHSPIPFYIYDHPVDGTRFYTNYRGRLYFVREASEEDATITILAILNDLLNLNRDANEIPTTKTVATTP